MWAPSAYARRKGDEQRCYWVRWDPAAERSLLVYPGKPGRPPPAVEPHYSIDAEGVVPEFGHPEGPSSVPYYRILGRRVYAAEGHPTQDAIPRYYIVSARSRLLRNRSNRNPRIIMPD